MSLLNPFALLGLLLVPVLVLLYFLKLKRPQVRVASTLLWQKVIEDMRVNSPFQRLKRSLLLLLQLLALLAFIFALARPLMRVRENKNDSIIVLIDNSASMLAVEPDGKTRLDAGKAAVMELVEHLARGDEMMLISFNSRARINHGFTDNKRLLKEAVRGIKETECTTDLTPALLLAKSIANSRSHPRILLFSDGAFPTGEEVELPVEVEYQRIGTARPNLAITGLDIRRSLHDRDKIEMFVAVRNFSDQAFEGNMAVHLDDQMLDSKYFSIGPEEALSQIFEAVLPSGGSVMVEFDVEDALACDNRAWKVVPPALPRRVLVVGEESFFLERVFKSSPLIEHVSIHPAEYDPSGVRGFSAVVWNNVNTPAVAPCHNIYLGCAPALEGLGLGGDVNSPDILDWNNTHPLNRFLDYDNLVISATREMSLPEYGSVVLRSTRTPLIGMVEAEGRTLCIVGFNPMRSNWPLLVSFPLFFNNCLNYFEEQAAKSRQANIAVGGTITVEDRADPPTVDLPDGRRATMKRHASGDYSFADVDRCGIYRVVLAEDDSYLVAANLFDADEVSLDTIETPVIGGKTVQAMQVQRQINREYWKYLLMCVAGLLLLEWVVYHRRIFV